MQSSGNQEGRLGRWTVTTGAWILAGLLLITASLLFSARVENRIFPSVTNVQPSGYAAFAELLRRDGYEVELDRSVKPAYDPTDIVVSTAYGKYNTDNDPSLYSEPEIEEDYEYVDPWDDLANYQQSLVEHIEQGGTVISVYSRMNFKTAEEMVENSLTISSVDDPETTYSLSVPNDYQGSKPLPYDESQVDVWRASDRSFVTYTQVDTGLIVKVNDGLGMSNRYLDKEQNAEFYLGLIRNIAPANSKIVFIEAGIDNAIVPSATNTLGHWAVAARWQLLLLFVVLVFTLAKRFGLPETDKRTQKGSRELFDAIADVFRRSKNTGLALDNLLLETDERIKSVIHAPSSISRSNMLQRVPEELKEQYLNVSELAVSACKPDDATKAAQKLLDQLVKFETDSRTARSLKRS